eukprot:10569360-Alexandrium_andersonii.AAC.1
MHAPNFEPAGPPPRYIEAHYEQLGVAFRPAAPQCKEAPAAAPMEVVEAASVAPTAAPQPDVPPDAAEPKGLPDAEAGDDELLDEIMDDGGDCSAVPLVPLPKVLPPVPAF